MRSNSDEPVRADQTAKLEQAFIAEFLERSGHTPDSLRMLPSDQAEALMKQASAYASGRLTEVESRAHFVHDIHHAANPPE